MTWIASDFPRSQKSPQENSPSTARAHIFSSDFGEDLVIHLKQPAVCRAFPNWCYVDEGEDDWKKFPPEKEEKLSLRSKTRHLHIVSQLENLEIGQNLHGRRSLSSTILNSECREYRFDQTIWSSSKYERLEWKNRKIILKKSQKIVPYDSPNTCIDIQTAEDALNSIREIMFVFVREADRKTEKYALVLREHTFNVFNIENPRNLVKKFVLPTNWKFLKIGWQKKNETIFIMFLGNGERLFLIFDVFSLEFVTSFVVNNNRIPGGKFARIALKYDVLKVFAMRKAIFFSFQEVWKNFGSFRKIPEISDGSELPIVFEISNFDEPIHVFEGDFESIHVSPSLPFIVGFPMNRLDPFEFINHKNPEIPINFGENFTLPKHRCGKQFTEFEMLNKKQSCLIFADDLTSTFLVFEKSDLVKYYVSNCSKVEQVWRTTIFPKVEDRNFHRRKSFEKQEMEDYGPEYGPMTKREWAERMFLYSDRILDNFIKIHDTILSDDNENIIINLSIEYRQLSQNGYFGTKQITQKTIMQFLYIIDHKNGEILRIIPIAKQNEKRYMNLSRGSISLEEDLLVIPKDIETDIPKMEIWELVEPQQFIDDEQRIEQIRNDESGMMEDIMLNNLYI